MTSGETEIETEPAINLKTDEWRKSRDVYLAKMSVFDLSESWVIWDQYLADVSCKL